MVVTLRAVTPADDELIAQHFYAMWQDLGVPAEDLRPDWLPTCLRFVEQARQDLGYQAFVAEVNGAVVGSAGGQRFDGLYPAVLMPHQRQYGYIWGVYVEPPHRRQGIATALTKQMVAYLQDLGCTKVVLNAAPGARSLYKSLGFSDSNLMELELKP